MNLVIVESPTKAKTISKFLGRKYSVKSSYGHVRDLPKKELGIDVEHGFRPHYVIPAGKEKKVAELKMLADKSESVILATDEDREGEAISWHLVEALGLDPKNTSRIVFHEITKKAIEKALENPRKIDFNLVDAQQARRVLDRLVGYELSPFLWKKIRRGLSAGRVQSVALRLIVEKEKEIRNFQPQEYWNVLVFLEKKSGDFFPAKVLKHNDKPIGKMGIKSQTEAEEIVRFLKQADFEVVNINRKEVNKSPLPPYTTSTLQQDANNNLGWSAKQTMMIAQKLYEGIALGKGGPVGLITYMRTDSFNLSLESMLSAKKVIGEKFGADYALENPRFFKTRSKGAQEAHEAIRPTHPEKDPESIKEFLEPKEYRLYNLIWKRMIASQMAPAVLDSLAVDVTAKQKDASDSYLLRSGGSKIKFDGYLKVYEEKAGTDVYLPELAVGEKLTLSKIEPEQKFTQPPARYNEASLIKTLEEYGIGRPSTYAPTISTVIERKYVNKDESRRLYPEEIGFLVSDLLVEHFADIVDYQFTANMEADLDSIAEGKKKWEPVIKDFYGPFHKNLMKKDKSIKKEDFQEKLDRKCPECQSDLVVKFGRFGKFIACSNYPKCKYTEKTDEEKKIDEANQGEICDVCGAPMVVKRSRFGSFLGCSNYPECKNIKKIEKKTGLTCPKCGKGEIVERRSKKGKTFYGCNSYPDCDFALWNKPTGEKCPKCQSLLIFAAKGKVRCSSKECDFQKDQEN